MNPFANLLVANESVRRVIALNITEYAVAKRVSFTGVFHRLVVGSRY
jgi:hypothetical protein